MRRNVNLLIGLRAWTGFAPWERLRKRSDLGVPVSLPLNPGLNVLYGRNGAGKSTLLEALKASLTGISSSLPVELYVRVPDMSITEGFPNPDRQAAESEYRHPHLPTAAVGHRGGRLGLGTGRGCGCQGLGVPGQ